MKQKKGLPEDEIKTETFSRGQDFTTRQKKGCAGNYIEDLKMKECGKDGLCPSCQNQSPDDINSRSRKLESSGIQSPFFKSGNNQIGKNTIIK